MLPSPPSGIATTGASTLLHWTNAQAVVERLAVRGAQNAASFEPVFGAGRCACAAPDPLRCSGFLVAKITENGYFGCAAQRERIGGWLASTKNNFSN
jgi:hypothetical protein